MVVLCGFFDARSLKCVDRMSCEISRLQGVGCKMIRHNADTKINNNINYSKTDRCNKQRLFSVFNSYTFKNKNKQHGRIEEYHYGTWDQMSHFLPPDYNPNILYHLPVHLPMETLIGGVPIITIRGHIITTGNKGND